ncbi:hypothetical protein GGR54DRAFT_431382 [Hypoxylon sp. NC1633]|nr:hypothetical protein GGR54DRAFT_431382 [Hypoxylon sp. NC1633]
MEPSTSDARDIPSSMEEISRTSDFSPQSCSIRTPTCSNRRPLRTYSKRPSTDVGEPVRKKRRVRDTKILSTPTAEPTEPTDNHDAREPSPSLPPPPTTKKGTIMSYFKIIPPTSSSTLHSSEPSSEPTQPESTPPSSPPAVSSQRKRRRRLTTRMISRATSEDTKVEDPIEGDEDGGELDGDHNESKPLEVKTGTLSDVSLDALNRRASRQQKGFEASKRGRSSKSATVQTTLSLSMDDKGFTECKECNMIYNPLHKEDAKYHAKRHAATLKAKATPQDNETSD